MNQRESAAEPDHLLVYGTLLRTTGHPYARLLHRHSTCLGRGSFPGRLYDLGSYPGAVYEARAAIRVHGDILHLPHPERVLPLLDEYEGYSPNRPRSSLFVRQRVEVESEQGPVRCWVYLYNRPVGQSHLVLSGDYAEYLRLKQ